MLVTEPLGSGAGLIGQLVVAPNQFELRAHLAAHLASSEPLPPQLAFGQIAPHPLDGARQQPLDG
jgi:hypothetical protein